MKSIFTLCCMLLLVCVAVNLSAQKLTITGPVKPCPNVAYTYTLEDPNGISSSATWDLSANAAVSATISSNGRQITIKWKDQAAVKDSSVFLVGLYLVSNGTGGFNAVRDTLKLTVQALPVYNDITVPRNCNDEGLLFVAGSVFANTSSSMITKYSWAPSFYFGYGINEGSSTGPYVKYQLHGVKAGDKVVLTYSNTDQCPLNVARTATITLNPTIITPDSLLITSLSPGYLCRKETDSTKITAIARNATSFTWNTDVSSVKIRGVAPYTDAHTTGTPSSTVGINTIDDVQTTGHLTVIASNYMCGTSTASAVSYDIKVNNAPDPLTASEAPFTDYPTENHFHSNSSYYPSIKVHPGITDAVWQNTTPYLCTLYASSPPDPFSKDLEIGAGDNVHTPITLYIQTKNACGTSSIYYWKAAIKVDGGNMFTPKTTDSDSASDGLLLAVSPNPTSNYINFTLGANKAINIRSMRGGVAAKEDNAEARLYDINNHLVKHNFFVGTTGKIDVSGLPAGMYILQVLYEQKTYSSKIVVVHSN